LDEWPLSQQLNLRPVRYDFRVQENSGNKQKEQAAVNNGIHPQAGERVNPGIGWVGRLK